MSLLLFLIPSLVFAQPSDRMKVTATLEPKTAAPGEIVTLKVHFDVEPGFHTYPTVQTDPNAKDFTTVFRVKAGPIEPAGSAIEPKAMEKFDPDLKATVGTLEGSFDIEVPFKVKAGTSPGPVKVNIRLQTQVCDTSCLPFDEKYDFDLTVKAGGTTAPVVPVKETTPAKQTAPDKEKPNVVQNPDKIKAADQPPATDRTLWSILVEAAGLGFVALLTPCVFPMIPITVSYFLKQKEGNNALTHSLLYTGTIIVSLAIFIYAFVELAQKLNYHWATNLFLGLLLMVFALSLFGMFEIRLPTFLSNWTSKGQDRGGYLGTIFMALTFMIISFSCVSPIVGVLGGLSAEKRPVHWNVLTALVFATCFALPFFLLSLFPTMLKKLPKSGGWLNSLKVILGILELAAALKFLRQSELNFKANRIDYMTYDVVLACYIGLAFVAGFYLLRVFRLPHDDEDYNQKSVGVGRFLWASIFISLGIYLFPGMFWAPNGQKQRPSGEIFAWVDSFLLQGDDTKPLPMSGKHGSNGSVAQEQKWIGFLNEAIADAKARKRRIFIDFTGINCQNCTKNERAIFSQADVKAAFENYTLLKLYTDTVPLEYYPTDKLDATTPVEQENDGEAHRLFEKNRFNTTELPFYVIIEPDGMDFKTIARYSVGLIRDKDEFLKFLRDNTGKK
ncbi:MAG TPA: cytochrome c biogenesis protein CcdA [Gemmatales bacterium]|nr:cytochrome c biogenesis protein CcdA [Gemmatales bacterium]